MIDNGFAELQSEEGEEPIVWKKQIKAVEIGSMVTSLGDNSNEHPGPFVFCETLVDAIIPNSVTCIGFGAFSGCSGLASITIPDSVTSIGYGAFDSCSGLPSITIPDSVTSIGYGAFLECTGLTSVTIGNSVISIGDDAFVECTGLMSVTIRDGVMSIGEGAFADCTGLTSVTIPPSVVEIGNGAFFKEHANNYFTTITFNGKVQEDVKNLVSDEEKSILCNIPKIIDNEINHGYKVVCSDGTFYVENQEISA